MQLIPLNARTLRFFSAVNPAKCTHNFVALLWINKWRAVHPQNTHALSDSVVQLIPLNALSWFCVMSLNSVTQCEFHSHTRERKPSSLNILSCPNSPNASSSPVHILSFLESFCIFSIILKNVHPLNTSYPTGVWHTPK